MGFATHLGPWLLGTVKNTTGTTAGLVRNTGCTVVAQPITVGFADINASLTATLGAIPAGSLITSVRYATSTVFSAATTLTVSIAGVAYAASASTITSVGTIVATEQATFTPVAVNVGSTDALIAATFTKGSTLTTGSVTIIITYVVRDSNGNAAPTASQQ
jgi:hypothetical protein